MVQKLYDGLPSVEHKMLRPQLFIQWKSKSYNVALFLTSTICVLHEESHTGFYTFESQNSR